jgi:lipoate-protein ligase A
LTQPNHKLRLIVDEPLTGNLNMGIDEAILEAVNNGESIATLRFYQWNEPTISLGYFQKAADFLEQDDTIKNMPMVRRQTGGGAILHDDEITYSLIVPLNGSLPFTNIGPMVELVHDAFISVNAEMGLPLTYRGTTTQDDHAQKGPFFCFSRSHCLDLTLDDLKIVGSAQRRKKNSALQHGSFILKKNYKQQTCAAADEKITSRFDTPGFIKKTSTIIATKLNLTMENGTLTDKERQYALGMEKKYASDDWTKQR